MAIDGILVVDKPAGMTSHDVVARMRSISGERSIGHLGTLDPMATGVLPLVLGRMTRLAQFYAPRQKQPGSPANRDVRFAGVGGRPLPGAPDIQPHQEPPAISANGEFQSAGAEQPSSRSTKVYEGEIRLGVVTDTYDADGEAVAFECRCQPASLSLEKIRQAAAAFRGRLWQLPPPFSAKKIKGVPAYKLARKHQAVELSPAEVQVEEFEIESLAADRVRFRAVVSPGTYVRSLAHDLGQALGCGAHLAALRRTRSAEFTVEDAHTLDEIAGAFQSNCPEQVSALFIHPRRILPEMPAVTAPPETVARLRNGGAVNLPEMSDAPLVKVFVNRRELLAIARRIAGTLFQPVVVMAPSGGEI
jgi:tRNA pseudouridine55 synthase